MTRPFTAGPVTALAAVILLTACDRSRTSRAPTLPHATTPEVILQTDETTPWSDVQARPRALIQRIPLGGECHLDLINGRLATSDIVTSASPAKPIRFEGWLVDSDKFAPGTFSLLLVSSNDAYGLKAETGDARPDVASALHAGGAEKAGFNVATQLSGVAAGTYQLIALIKKHGVNERCDMHQSVLVL